jgi:DNA-directed RNA polymerase subunit RPC12/RpoP
MYKCTECGEVFPYMATWQESYGERLQGCPYCFNPAYPAYECLNCGEWCLDDELEDGLCEKCYSERGYDDE